MHENTDSTDVASAIATSRGHNQKLAFCPPSMSTAKFKCVFSSTAWTSICPSFCRSGDAGIMMNLERRGADLAKKTLAFD